MQDFEKLGSFYLGKLYDPVQRRAGEDLVLYDARDLTTHAVCIGMTGSGKTGLCIGLLEEAAIDGIPALVVDPKGELTNLMLAFPDLAPSDFQPWVDPEEARRRGTTVETLAQEESSRWRQGLAEWGQSADRIRRMRAAAEFAVYTPGRGGRQGVSILSSLGPPPEPARSDADELGERAASTATSLLGLLGIEADPLRSREHVLLSTILASAWKGGRKLQLSELIQQVQKPPFAAVGVVELESFYPTAARRELAMALNNMLAAPSFQDWLDGEPLDVGRMLFDAAGKPRISIFSIAHLNDAERMFFVSLLLNQTIAWMRSQPGTSSLRAVLYMDEILGYLPPIANPPSKPPLLVLLKQARAFGLGVVLSTQNPVDLDYKGLANAGTWFIGKLQTERDRARLLDGLEAAGSGLDRGRIEELLDALGSRVFLLHDVHRGGPQLFTTRWTLSYLRGPMTREEIRRLGERAAQPVEGADQAAVPAPTPAPAGAPPAGTVTPPAPTPPGTQAAPLSAASIPSPPLLPPDVPQVFLPVRGVPPAGCTLVYVPMLLGRATVRFAQTKAGIDMRLETALLARVPETGTAAWLEGRELPDATETQSAPPAGPARFAAIATPASQPRSYSRWTRDLADWLYRNRKLDLWRCVDPPLVSKPGESERDFRIRLRDAGREARDTKAESLRAKYAPRMARLQEMLRRAEQARARETEQAEREKVQAAVSVGATLLGAFLGGGRRSTVGKATTAMRGIGRAQRQAGDVARAAENVEAVQRQIQDLNTAFEADLAAQTTAFDPQTVALEPLPVVPKKADVAVRSVQLAWAPHWEDEAGRQLPAWE